MNVPLRPRLPQVVYVRAGTARHTQRIRYSIRQSVFCTRESNSLRPTERLLRQLHRRMCDDQEVQHFAQERRALCPEAAVAVSPNYSAAVTVTKNDQSGVGTEKVQRASARKASRLSCREGQNCPGPHQPRGSQYKVTPRQTRHSEVPPDKRPTLFEVSF